MPSSFILDLMEVDESKITEEKFKELDKFIGSGQEKYKFDKASTIQSLPIAS